MRRIFPSVAMVAGTLALAAVPASAATWHHCPGGFDPHGHASRRNDVWRAIRTQRTTCKKARAVIVVFIGKSHANPPSIAGRRFEIKGFSCRMVTKQGRDNPYGAASCKASRGRRISFIAAG
jgi:hypothetical protein